MLALIAVIYLVRGILGIPAILVAHDSYSEQLRAKMTFMVLTSAICLILGLCYAVGAVQVWRKPSSVAA